MELAAAKTPVRLLPPAPALRAEPARAPPPGALRGGPRHGPGDGDARRPSPPRSPRRWPTARAAPTSSATAPRAPRACSPSCSRRASRAPASGLSMKSSISMSGPTWWLEMKASTSRPDRSSTAAMNLCCMAFWKALRVSWTIGRALQLDHRLLDVGVDAAEHAGEQVVAEQQRLGRHRRAVVVALVQRRPSRRSPPRAGHRRSGERLGADIAAFSLVLRGGFAREAKGEDPTCDSPHTIAPTGYDREVFAIRVHVGPL